MKKKKHAKRNFFQISSSALVHTWAKLDNFTTKNSLVAFGARRGSLDVHVILSGFGWLWTSGGGGCASLNHRKWTIKGLNSYDLFEEWGIIFGGIIRLSNVVTGDQIELLYDQFWSRPSIFDQLKI